ncbi:MAG: hypothetical protein ACRDTM_07265, partial [Micromonosporaceae bacterium]
PYPGAAALSPRHDPGPRPPQVTLAVMLTFVGIGIAFLGVLLLFLGGIDASPGASTGGDRQARQAAAGAFILGGVNLMVATGTAVAAVFTLRGANPARVVLCVLCGLFAGWKLTCGGVGLVGRFTGNAGAGNFGMGVAAYALDLVLMVLALVIITLLLLGPSHQYFSRPRRIPSYDGPLHFTTPGRPV